MSKRKDTDKSASAAAESPIANVSAPAAAASEQPISLSSSEPAKAEAPAVEAVIITPAVDPVIAAAAVEASKPIEMPKPVEAVMKTVEALQPDSIEPSPRSEPHVAPAVAAAAVEQAAQWRGSRFALLAASVAFAGAVGAMAGALTAAVISHAPAQASQPAIDLSALQDTISSLRTELSSIKSSVDTSSRNTSAQFAKFNDRLERIDRAQAAPAAQLKNAMEAIERLERRAQAPAASPETTSSVRPQQAAVTPPPEPSRPQLLEGWVVRHVSRGVAVIHGRRIGIIEVEAGDVVPGVGRIESIRRQDGRWVVVTSKGLIPSATNTALPPMAR